MLHLGLGKQILNGLRMDLLTVIASYSVLGDHALLGQEASKDMADV
jgi:hypothetical protein